jgi:hypothetical protein
MISESIMRLVILMVTLCVILWINATVFDATEIRTLVLFFLGAAGLEGGTGYLKNTFGKKKE